MPRVINLLKLFPAVLLSSCSTSYHPQNTNLATATDDSRREILFQQPAKPDNCGVGCPTGGGQQTIYRDVYTLNNNSVTKFANWVAYNVTKTSQASGRPRNWAQDPDLPPSDTLAPSAYNNAHARLKVDRGHQAPLAGLGGVSDWPALNYLSNITPQKSALNQGAWAALEKGVRELAKQADVSAVHVVTGPLFERHIATLPEDATVEIPSGYWKVLFTGTAPSESEGNYAAFIMDQNTPRSGNFCDYQVTVQAIEGKTKPALTLWSTLPEKVASVVKTTKGRLAQKLGCR
ncbi:DNA/RNA non-specific endonuclease [Salmonella enterica subsp. salamae]|nr:DNA/RNA non-specific endonuclease [Salmonella enterica subsp. salamae]ECJ2280145.1 DNA/RNA non-specific endonuclease [Salmonella enterica subsp. salamae]